MAQQADDRTQSMMAQRQSGKDWWYQSKRRRWRDRKARASYRPANPPDANYAKPVTPAMQAPSQTPAAKEIMVWPTLLKEDAFDDLRAKVEAPFRRAYADNKPLTADDYRGILQAVDEMKAKLKGISSQVRRIGVRRRGGIFGRTLGRLPKNGWKAPNVAQTRGG